MLTAIQGVLVRFTIFGLLQATSVYYLAYSMLSNYQSIAWPRSLPSHIYNSSVSMPPMGDREQWKQCCLLLWEVSLGCKIYRWPTLCPVSADNFHILLRDKIQTQLDYLCLWISLLLLISQLVAFLVASMRYRQICLTKPNKLRFLSTKQKQRKRDLAALILKILWSSKKDFIFVWHSVKFFLSPDPLGMNSTRRVSLATSLRKDLLY